MKNEPNYLIKDLADKTGLSHDTIRFYEKKQLIQPSFRGSNNYRYYNDDALKRLLFIKRCRALAMTLKEIQELVVKNNRLKTTLTLNQEKVLQA
jgi:DNA-binding transcriptional MerR regulator